jgi:DMSO/TMAO reductase YedYZ molybdopterin-dependent catalytic subunit
VKPIDMISRRLAFRILLLGWLAAAMVSGQANQQQAAPATLTVSGDIPSKLTLKAEDFAKMPRETVSVPDQDGTKIQYEGVPLREILKRAGAPMEKELRGKALASYILAKAHDGYQVVFTLAEVAPEFANEPILVADKRDGKPLFGYQGPFRLVCPNDKAGARSVRMLETLEIVQLQK